MTGNWSGPWKWHWRFESGEANGSVYAEHRKGHAYAIAKTPRYETKAQWEANARLIAAAPDLYEALRILTDNIEHAFPGLKHLGPLQNARTALAKATGNEGRSVPADTARETV